DPGLRRLPLGMRAAPWHVLSGRRVRKRRRLPGRLRMPRQRLRHDALLRRIPVRGRRRMRRRRGLPTVLHLRRLRGPTVRLPGVRLRGVRSLHRRRRPRLPPAMHAGLGLPTTPRGVRELDVRVGALHQLEPLPVAQKGVVRLASRMGRTCSGGSMRTLLVAVAFVLLAVPARAAGPRVLFTLPAENATPATFGTLPWPDDLYFDQGRPGAGAGTRLDRGASIGPATAVMEQNSASVEDALDLMDGFGTTSAIYFFFSGTIDPASLPSSPRTAPAYGDSVFCANAA